MDINHELYKVFYHVAKTLSFLRRDWGRNFLLEAPRG